MSKAVCLGSAFAGEERQGRWSLSSSKAGARVGPPDPAAAWPYAQQRNVPRTAAQEPCYVYAMLCKSLAHGPPPAVLPGSGPWPLLGSAARSLRLLPGVCLSAWSADRAPSHFPLSVPLALGRIPFPIQREQGTHSGGARI